jgi:hypothetical protein
MKKSNQGGWVCLSLYVVNMSMCTYCKKTSKNYIVIFVSRGQKCDVPFSDATYHPQWEDRED